MYPAPSCRWTRLGRCLTGRPPTWRSAPVVEQYRSWIELQRAEIETLPDTRRDTARGVVAPGRRRCGSHGTRYRHRWRRTRDVLDAFRVANRAVARALRQRLRGQFTTRPPSLARLSASVHSAQRPRPGRSARSRPRDSRPALLPDRRRQDGGVFGTRGARDGAAKTPQSRSGRSSGCGRERDHAVHAASAHAGSVRPGVRSGVCAGVGTYSRRREDTAKWPFEIGLWVGKAATPNFMGRKGDNRSDSARARTRQYKADPGSKPSPVPLESCPWCSTRFAADSFALWPNDDRPEELRIFCTNLECDFNGDRPLPVLAVDEPIYRRLPAFLIATVDKFASLPWEARTGVLLGGADRYDKSGFHGAAEPRAGRRLSNARFCRRTSSSRTNCT